MITPATPASTNDSNEPSQALVTLAQQLDLAGQGTVVAGSMAGSGPGSAIDVMRADGRAGHLSSVDNADSPVGQIVVAQALFEQRTHGKSGSYGVPVDRERGGPKSRPDPVTHAAGDARWRPTPGPGRPGQQTAAKP